MPMYPCNRCLENNWTYAHNEGIVTATCKACGDEVQFLTRQEQRKRAGLYVPKPADVPQDRYRDNAGEDETAPWD